MKPTKWPAEEKQMRQEKQNKREERKQKLKVKAAVLLLNPKNFGLSAHARTSQANILHLDQKTAKCTTCKPIFGKF